MVCKVACRIPGTQSAVSQPYRAASGAFSGVSGVQRSCHKQRCPRVATAAAATASMDELAEEIRGEDFYSLLGGARARLCDPYVLLATTHVLNSALPAVSVPRTAFVHLLGKCSRAGGEVTEVESKPVTGVLTHVHDHHVHAVSPRCTPAEVKAAYRGLMRDLHPDLALSSQDEEMKDQAHMLAVLLNEIVSVVTP